MFVWFLRESGWQEDDGESISNVIYHTATYPFDHVKRLKNEKKEKTESSVDMSNRRLIAWLDKTEK
jgi:hypothetical protein